MIFENELMVDVPKWLRYHTGQEQAKDGSGDVV